MSAGNRFCPTCGADVSGPQGNVATAHVPRAEPARPTVTDAALLEALRHATLGEYEILAELGRGGMATVFLAHDLSLDRKVAIKVMAPALLAGEGMVERFKREARTSAQLSHPNIIPIFAVREGENLVYFVMKFIEGRSLESIIRELGRLPIPMAQSILQQVGGALAYAHRRGVIHRDVKPGNIMIDADGWAVVTDFGIAKVSEAQGLTMTGATVGTPSYMSPEQCAAKGITPASDQYSYGIVAHEMIAGKQPFTGDSIMAIMYQHFNEPPPPLRQLRPDCPPELEAAVLRMLEKDPAARFPDLDAAAAAIGGAPLAPDDPIRTQLMGLAATSLQSQILKTVATPRTPVPTGRIPPGGTSARREKAEPTTGMSLAPARVTVAVGGYVQLTATRRSRAGHTLPGSSITWASTDQEVATVDDNGLVTAVGPGTAIITASMGTVSATGTVTVTPAQRNARSRVFATLGVLLALGGIAFAAWRFGPWRASGTAVPPVASGAESTRVASVPPAPRPEQSSAAPANPTTADTGAAAAGSPPPPEPAARPRRRETGTRIGALTRPPAAVPAPDTLVPGVRRRALEVRQQAVAAGATPADLAAGDALAEQARLLAEQDRRADALGRLSEAIASWNGAATAARQRAAAVTAPVSPPPPVAAAPAPADPRPAIEETIAQYGRAVESRSVDAVRRVYPALPPARERVWRDFFQSVRELRVTLRTTGVELSGGDAALATVAATMEFRGPDGKQQHQQDRFVATLRRSPTGGWLIAEIR